MTPFINTSPQIPIYRATALHLFSILYHTATKKVNHERSEFLCSTA
nr:MAG TPA: hypothetical protein [Caudoviricetes sp.]